MYTYIAFEPVNLGTFYSGEYHSIHNQTYHYTYSLEIISFVPYMVNIQIILSNRCRPSWFSILVFTLTVFSGVLIRGGETLPNP